MNFLSKLFACPPTVKSSTIQKERNFSAQFKISSSILSFLVDFPAKEIIHDEYKGTEEHHLLTFTTDCAKRTEEGANSPSDVEKV